MVTRKTLVPLALAAALLTVAGCSSTTDPSPTSTATQSGEPIATSDLPALLADAPAPGQVLADETDAEAARAAGRGVYHASDDTLIAIDPLAELPESVIADLRTALAIMSTQPEDDAAEQAQAAALLSALDAINQTGKQAVLIVPAFAIDTDKTVTEMTVVITEVDDFLTDGVERAFPDPDAARTYVTERVAQYEQPATFAVVDVTGWA